MVITKPPVPRRARDKQPHSSWAHQRMHVKLGGMHRACADLPIVSAGLRVCLVVSPGICPGGTLSLLCIFTKERVTHDDVDDDVCVFVGGNTLVKRKVGQGADGRTFA